MTIIELYAAKAEAPEVDQRHWLEQLEHSEAWHMFRIDEFELPTSYEQYVGLCEAFDNGDPDPHLLFVKAALLVYGDQVSDHDAFVDRMSTVVTVMKKTGWDYDDVVAETCSQPVNQAHKMSALELFTLNQTTDWYVVLEAATMMAMMPDRRWTTSDLYKAISIWHLSMAGG